MSLVGRKVGRRLAAVSIATGLLMVGLAAPALAAAPAITSFLPTGGPAGCQVTITGTDFTSPNVTKVTFGADTGSPADQTTVQVDSSTQVRAAVPSGAVTGKLTVTSSGGTSAQSSGTFTFGGSCVSPSITSFSPTSGPVGTTVTITGTNFTGATAVDFHGTVAASFVVVNPTQINALVPSGATTGKIRVATATGGMAESSSGFTVTAAAAPTITSFAPTSGPAGTSVVITGTNFSTVSSVTFNHVSATFTINYATKITAIVPVGATTGRIRVYNPSGNATSSSNFRVTAAAAPTVTSFFPTFGPVGKSVTITGTNFSGTGFATISVKFNGVSATFYVRSATQITATVPTGATTGKITVTTPRGTATSAGNFTVSTLHARSVSLSLRRRLIASGQVSVSDGFTACVQNVPVRIQRWLGGWWHTVRRAQTNSFGAYRTRLNNVAGTYRARATRVVLGGSTDICHRATSPMRRHR